MPSCPEYDVKSSEVELKNMRGEATKYGEDNEDKTEFMNMM